MPGPVKFTVTEHVGPVEIRTSEDGRVRAYCPTHGQIHRGWFEPWSAYGQCVKSDAEQHVSVASWHAENGYGKRACGK